MATPGPPRAEKLIFSDKTLACSNDSSPIHICCEMMLQVLISQKVGSLLGPYFKAWGSLLVLVTVLVLHLYLVSTFVSGGCLKRAVARANLTRIVRGHIITPQQFYEFCREKCEGRDSSVVL